MPMPKSSLGVPDNGAQLHSVRFAGRCQDRQSIVRELPIVVGSKNNKTKPHQTKQTQNKTFPRPPPGWPTANKTANARSNHRRDIACAVTGGRNSTRGQTGKGRRGTTHKKSEQPRLHPA